MPDLEKKCMFAWIKLYKMKRILISAAVVALMISAVSCKQCVTCHYEYQYLGETKTVTYPEECGKSSEIKDFKTTAEAEAKMQGSELVCDDTK
jgi:histone acetyltransferase (RNA polymerase elongator complex component)